MEYKDHSHNRLDENLIRRAAGIANRQLIKPALSLAATKLKDPDLGRKVQDVTGGGAGFTSRIQSAIFNDKGKSDSSNEKRSIMQKARAAAGRVGSAVKTAMKHDPQSPGRRLTALKAVGGSINRGIGGVSPGSMKGVFANDPYTTKMRPAGPVAGEGLTPEQRAMARQIQQLTNVSYGEAIAQVLASQQGIRPAEASPAPKGSATIGGAGSRTPRSDDHRDPSPRLRPRRGRGIFSPKIQPPKNRPPRSDG